MRRLPRLLILAAAFVALAVTISACAAYKPGSFQVSQPAGIGDVRFHLELCSEDEELSSEEACNPGDRTGQAQLMLAFAVPKGSTVPATVTAAPGPGATPIVYSRNQEVAGRVAELERAEGEPAWPPPGSEIVGYLSGVVEEKEGEELEWTIDANVGLPAAADGGSFGGPIGAALATGWRAVEAGLPADRPINCFEGEPPFLTGFCGIDEELQAGVSDLRIIAAPTTANVGASASIPFSLDFASSASALPSFALSATTTLPGATVALPENTFAPPAASPGSRVPLTPRAVNVTVPAKAQPGTYDVTITAATATGGSVSQVAKLTVSKLKIGFGKLKLNKRKGTATLQVKVPAAGTLTVSGKKIVKVKRSPKVAKTVKVKIRAKGKAKTALSKTGKAKVKAKVSFKPQSGSAVVRTKSITLKKSL
jgi:hypothetical protein